MISPLIYKNLRQFKASFKPLRIENSNSRGNPCAKFKVVPKKIAKFAVNEKHRKISIH